jgi:transposase-like protein
MGRRGYPPEFRRRVLDLLTAGRKVTDLARDLGISDQTIYTWRRQEQIDRGLVAGLRHGRRPVMRPATLHPCEPDRCASSASPAST